MYQQTKEQKSHDQWSFSVDAEKASDRNLTPFIIKTLENIGTSST